MIASRTASPGSPAGGDARAAALVAAGRLLQSRGWPGGSVRIQAAPGETYPQAVARTIAALPEHERAALRELVAWVRDYERASMCLD